MRASLDGTLLKVGQRKTDKGDGDRERRRQQQTLPPPAQPQPQPRRSTLPPPPLVEAEGHQHHAAAAPAASWGERIRPERTPPRRNNVQKMQWRSSRWVDGFLQGAASTSASAPGGPQYGGSHSDQELDSRISSMTIADVSPRFAVKRIILLYENSQFREAANFINRLSHSTFKVILTELPIDLFVESMPHSLSILEALYAKVFLSDGLDFSVRLLRPEAVILQMARVFSDGDPPAGPGAASPLVCSCKKLLKVIVLSEPKLRKALQQRRRALDKAIEGLGQHGLVGTSDETLTNLHDALKVEFQRMVETYKGALQKLDELSLADGAAVTRGPAPVQASHQRQLALRPQDVQDRLIKNKTLLNVVEPTLGSRSLDVLLGILRRRVDHDKDALFQFTQLRRELGDACVPPGAVLAPVLMRFSRGCDRVLELMKEVAEDDDDSSDISGYHSDSDSAIMMSGNSPYVSKRARYNFLTRSVRSSGKSSARLSVLNASSSASGSDSPPTSLGHTPSEHPPVPVPATRSRHLKHKKELHKLNSAASSSSGGTVACTDSVSAVDLEARQRGREILLLKAEVQNLQEELSQSDARLRIALEMEQRLRERLAMATHSDNGSLSVSSVGEQLVHCYRDLYQSARVDTLDALDSLPLLKDADELKSKILFSVIVLAFRSTQSLLALKKDHVQRVLHIPQRGSAQHEAAVIGLEAAISLYLRQTAQDFDLSRNVEEVCSQIWATLYDYPCLKDCPGLIQYVKDAVRLAWCLINQSPPYVLEYEQRVVRKDMHVRFHLSNPENDQIRTYLWPALLEGPGGPCVHKAVVIT
ncbi:uncharacterized protein LOC126353934 [Schistocerca gregaria]|uniref:uncharacterized protein LOC126353934 n=1 Tax=Schistocerca gregaria TaxID=7010 RepID=UPI00211EE857|nr:uncharacterized protein LOC126353934 [Schistocerca gregaria]